jgi:lysophospholipase L1-like esterase
VTCSPASGTTFPLGATTVSCSATDSATPPRTAACSFAVTLVPPPPVLTLTNFLAFGDSITKGEINDDSGGSCDPGPASTSALVHPQTVMPDLAYPAVVLRLLTARYTTQTFSMANEGKGTETAKDGTLRFPGVIATHQPEALLLLQGIIDIKDTGDPDAPIEALTTDIRIAKADGVQAIFISTLLPVGTGFQGCGIENATVRAANDLIRALAIREDVHLVDTYAAFAGRVDTLIGSDGLHPTAAGQQVIADTFFDAIKTALETNQTSASRPTRLRIAARRPIVR